jgi:hypothetical protein
MAGYQGQVFPLKILQLMYYCNLPHQTEGSPMHYKFSLAAILAFALTACGGANGNDQKIWSEEGLAYPAATVVSPTTATLGVVTTFTVSGSDLSSGMLFQLANCDGTTELAGGTASARKFSCTPSGTAGAHTGKVMPNATTTTSLLTFQITFQ